VRTLTVRAPAKINLHLEVLGRRPDGYHEVRTLLQTVDLADTLAARPAPGGRLVLRVEPEGSAPADGGNLVLRAAEALRGAAGCDAGAELELVKRIPAGAGLGGGSSDAAAALLLLRELWGLAMDDGGLARIAAELGADVPFFLLGGLAVGYGRGDEVVPLPDLEPLEVAIAWPETPVATAEAYRRLDAPLTWGRPSGTVFAVARGAEPPWGAMRNDLEPVAAAMVPAVGALLGAMRAAGALRAAVSGSGSAVFGLFRSRERARAAARSAISAGAAGTYVGRTLPRAAAGPRPA